MNKISSFKISNLFSAIKVSFWTGSSRVFGLLRDISTTNLFGASIYHDIFVVVLRIPNLFRRFFAEGAFNQAFVPILSDFESNKPQDEIKDFIDSMAGLLILTLFLFTVFALAFAPFLIFIFAPGFYFDPDKQMLSVTVLKIMFPYLALISLVAFAGGIQNTHSKFSLPAATPLIFNLTLIIFALIIAPKTETPLFTLAWGVFAAGILQLIIQLAPLAAINRLPIPRLNFSNKGIKKFFRIVFPAILAGGITQINLLIDTIFASLLQTGSPTWLYISDRLIQFPLGIFAIAVGTVLLPSLSKSVMNQNFVEYKKNLHNSFRLVTFIALPSMVGLICLAEPIISTLFYRGDFLKIDVIQSAYSLVFFCYGLPFFMMMKVLTPAFFSRQDTKTPFYIAVFSLLINGFLNYFLAFKIGLGHGGLALGSSIAVFLSVTIMLIILSRSNFISFSILWHRTNLTSIVSSLILLVIFILLQKMDLNLTNYFYDFNEVQRIASIIFITMISIFIYFAINKFIFNVNLKDFY